MSLHQRIKSDLTRAMKSRETNRVRVLRSLLTTIGNAEAVADSQAESDTSIGPFSTEAERRELSDEDVSELLKTEIRELQDAEDVYRSVGAPDRVESIRRDVEFLEAYLDTQD